MNNNISYQRMATSVIRAAIGKAAPFFKGTAWNSPTQSFQEVSLDTYKNKWLLLFFYPLDFTFVCPTEIVEFSNKAKHFRENGCQVLGVSIDSHFTHLEYTKKPRSQGGLGNIDIPLLADINKQTSDKYGVLTDGGIAFRGTFIIDNHHILRHLSINDLPVGRNVDEYLRLLQAFQYNQKHGEVCPASWKAGDRSMKPDLKSDALASYWKEVHGKK